MGFRSSLLLCKVYLEAYDLFFKLGNFLLEVCAWLAFLGFGILVSFSVIGHDVLWSFEGELDTEEGVLLGIVRFVCRLLSVRHHGMWVNAFSLSAR